MNPLDLIRQSFPWAAGMSVQQFAAIAPREFAALQQANPQVFAAPRQVSAVAGGAARPETIEQLLASLPQINSGEEFPGRSLAPRRRNRDDQDNSYDLSEGGQYDPGQVLGLNGIGYNGVKVRGTPYAFVNMFAGGEGQPTIAQEIANLKSRGVTVVNDAVYGPLALTDSAYGAVHGKQKEDGFSKFINFAIPFGVKAGLAFGGGQAASSLFGGGGPLSSLFPSTASHSGSEAAWGANLRTAAPEFADGGMSTIQTAFNPETGVFEAVGGPMSTTAAVQSGAAGAGFSEAAGGIGLAAAGAAAANGGFGPPGSFTGPGDTGAALPGNPGSTGSGPIPVGGISGAISRLVQGAATAGDLAALGLGAAAVGGIAAAGSGGLLNPSTTQTRADSTPPMTPEELALIKLNTQLTQKQLENIDQLAPFQKELLMQALEQARQQKAYTDALNTAVTPEQYAAAAKSDFERTQALGPIQQELLQRQLDAVRRNGAATPEQEALIRNATDQAIAAGTGDIDTQTQRGIGLISDELANSRGLRLTDTPIAREATLLTSRAEDNKASLIRNLRAAQATSQLNYPLAVQQVQNQTSQNQQQINDAATQFQAQLRQQAQANRLALLGQTSSTGIGLAGIGGGGSALSALSSSRLANNSITQSTTPGIGLTQIGQAATDVGRLFNAGSSLF